MTDPGNKVMKYFYDALGRRVGTVENLTSAALALGWDTSDARWEPSGGPNPNDPDENRLSTTVFDGVGNIAKLVAFPTISDPQDVQETIYTYGASTTDPDLPSLINSGGLLATILYPADTVPVRYAYNALGEMTAVVDQNGTRHDYVRDDRGRITSDSVSAPSPAPPEYAIDLTADSIETEFDEFGRLKTVSTKSGTTVLNQMAYEYDEVGRPIKLGQNHVGEAVDGSGALLPNDLIEVTFVDTAPGIDPSEGNESTGNNRRMTGLAYAAAPPPSGLRTVVTFGFGAIDSLDDDISRLSSFEWPADENGGANVRSVAHEFVGLGRRVVSTYANVSDALIRDRWTDPDAGTQVAGTYPGLDRFGRVRREVWHDDNTWDPTARPAAVDFAYAYDKSFNITSRIDSRAGAAVTSNRREYYTHDGLNRLEENARGSAASPEWASQRWTLDVLGNWDTVESGALTYSASTGYVSTESRSHNEGNEIISAGAPGDERALDHDEAGNIIAIPLPDGPSGTQYRRVLVHDGWDRLVRVDVESRPDAQSSWANASTRGAYTYFGGNQRATRVVDTGSDALPDLRVHYLYDHDWQLLEERLDEQYSGPWAWDTGDLPVFANAFTEDQLHQYIWDPTSFDQLVLFQKRESSTDPDLAGRHFWAMTDRGSHVVSLVPYDATNSVNLFRKCGECRYSAYGVAQHVPRGDIHGDGNVSVLDPFYGAFGKSVGDPAYKADADFDLSGAVDIIDFGVFGPAFGTTVLPGEPWLMRNRWYSATLGRFITHDPAGYIDGMSLYSYAISNPLRFVDPLGLSIFQVYEADPTTTTYTSEGGNVVKTVDVYKKGRFFDSTWEYSHQRTSVQDTLTTNDLDGQGGLKTYDVEGDLTEGITEYNDYEDSFKHGAGEGMAEICSEYAVAAGVPIAGKGAKAAGKAGRGAAGRAAKAGCKAFKQSAKCSRKLARNLGKKPGEGWAAHHLVGADRHSREAREVLQRYEIDINSAENGMHLPGHAVPEGERGGLPLHSGPHPADYGNEVSARLKQAQSRDEAIQILQGVREDVGSGALRITGPSQGAAGSPRQIAPVR